MRKDSVTLAFSIPREVYNVLISLEQQRGRYRTRVAAELFVEALSATTNNPEALKAYIERRNAPRAMPDFDF